MNQFRKGDRFETLKKALDNHGKKVPKGSIVVMYDMQLECDKKDRFFLMIKGVTTRGQMVQWALDPSHLKKLPPEDL